MSGLGEKLKKQREKGLVGRRLALPCVTIASQQERWRRHFRKVLNVQSGFDAAELGKVRERPSKRGLESLPGRTEVARALGKIKNGKASGSSNILPEMAKDEKNNLNFLDMLVDVMTTVWKERNAPRSGQIPSLFPFLRRET